MAGRVEPNSSARGEAKQPCDKFPQHFTHKPKRLARTLDELQNSHTERCDVRKK